MTLFLKRPLVQISMVFSKGMWIQSESVSKLPIKLLESCLTICYWNLAQSGKVKRVFHCVFVNT